MAALDCLLGNDALKADLAAALAGRRLSQSILLLGEAGLGTGFAARCLAADFLYPAGGAGAQQVLRGENPECLSVRGEGASGDIPVDRIRTVCAEISTTSLSAEGRAVILYGAHHLRASSANALLKSLEEPPEGVLFILTAPSAANVLPTIRSRCCAYPLAPVDEAACADYLARTFPDRKAEAKRLAALCGGRIGSAQKCLSTPEGKALFDDACALAQCAEARDAYGALVILAKYEKDRAAALSVLGTLRMLCGAALAGRPGAQLSPARAAVCVRQAGDAVQRLTANVHTKLVLTCFAVWMTAPEAPPLDSAKGGAAPFGILRGL